jgi:UDP-N-acetylmuramate dehydrogenase
MADGRRVVETVRGRSLTNEFRLQLKALLRGKVLFDESMALHTSLGTGGQADCFAVPADVDELRHLVSFLSANLIPYFVVGGGCNLLVRDGGFRGVAISLEELTGVERSGAANLEAEAGIDNRSLVRFAMDNGLGGLEFLVGIPGKLGGALAMNAGAGGHSVMDTIDTLCTLMNGSINTRRKEELEFGYRFLRLAPGEIIVAASFRLCEECRTDVEKRMEGYLEHRRKTQQVGFPTAGSFFKNPAGEPAWRLIDEAGLRGYRIGGAQVSEIHTNFLVNRGGAKSADFLELAEYIKRTVRERTGIVLEEEVRIVGDE